MGSNTGKSDVTSFQLMCYAIIVYICCRTFSHAVKSLPKLLVPIDSLTRTVFTLFISDWERNSHHFIETLPIYKQ